MRGLAGRTALATGGGSGLGAACAARLAAEGAAVAIVDLRADAAETVAACIPLGRLGRPEEVAGAALPVDGGFLAR
jgi:NAD(P)-dependent dehydrogenase (short-subunit alcohol dehydrogenase family)